MHDEQEAREALDATMRAMCSDVPLHRMLGFEIEGPAEDGHATLRMPIAPGALGTTGNLHGGAIATLCDVACAWASRRSVRLPSEDATLVTTDLHVRFVGRPSGTSVRAQARVVHAGSKVVVVECKVLDDDDHVVAVADASSMVVVGRRPLEE